MKKILILALLGILVVTNLSHSQGIPDAVQKYMYQLQHDPSVEYGFDYAKMLRFIEQNVQFQDWFVGLPFQFYVLNVEKLGAATVDTKFEDLIEPTNQWCIPIKIKNDSYLYHVNVEVLRERINPFGCGEDVIGFNTQDKVRKKFPEESGIRPIFIDYPFQLLYFRNKNNGKNIFHARNPKWDDSMSKVTSKSLDNLDDGKTVVPLLKDKIEAYKEQKELETLPANFTDTTKGNK